MTEIKNILITSIGGDISQAVSKIIKEQFDKVKIIGTDTSRENAGKYFCNKFYLVSHGTNKKYLDEICNISKEESIDIIIPISEIEINALYELPKEIKSKVISVKKEIFQICSDKLKTYTFLKNNKILVPWTVSAHDELPKSYPAIFKARQSSGSRSISIIENEIDAEWHQSKKENYIFQELLVPHDKEITCAIYRSISKETSIIQIHRNLVGGRTSWGKVVDYADVRDTCFRVAECLDLHGSINIQLIITRNGPMIFEINPRFSSTVYMRHKVGYKDLLWQLFEHVGQEITPKSVTTNHEMVRVDDVIIG